MTLSPRLKKAYDLLGSGEVFIDVGCDHAYLAEKLIADGRYSRAVAADIAEGPLASARENIESAGLGERCTFILSDGLKNVPVLYENYSVAICGMGGELISLILESSGEHTVRADSFVLQPMTKAEILRSFLWKSGFEIINDCGVRENDKVYAVILARYTGETEQYTAAEAYIGKRSCRETDEDTLSLLEKQRKKQVKIYLAKEHAGKDAAFEKELIRAIDDEIVYTKEKINERI